MSGAIANPYENFIALSRYARWLEKENRRETWQETVDRYFDFMVGQLESKHKYKPDPKIVDELRDAVFNRNVMPSMRSVMTAGAALEREMFLVITVLFYQLIMLNLLMKLCTFLCVELG